MSTLVRPRRTARVAVPLGIVTAAAVAGAVISVGSSSVTGTTAAATTRTTTVTKGVIQSTVSGSGSLAAQRDRELAFATAGTVKTVKAAAGDHVAKGQVLATLKTTAGTKKRLNAPFAGVIASADIGTGDTVGGASSGSSTGTSPTSGSSSDTTTAFELVSLKGYDMTVSLSESDIGKVKRGQMATVTVDATSDELAARVQRVALLPTSSSSDTTGSTSSASAVSYAVTLRLTQTAADIKPGMSASADIVTSQSTGLVVPTAALRGNQVTVVRNGRKTATQVQTGTAGDTTTEIVSGLNAGDQVVVTSASARAGATSSTGTSTTSTQQNRPSFGGAGGFTGGPPAGGPPGGGFGG